MNNKSKRFSPFKKGMAEGSVKQAVEKVVSPISEPVAEAIVSNLVKIHPGIQVTTPMIHTLAKSAVIMGLAEMLDLISPFVGERTNYDAKKIELASEFMRKHAGEKVGEQVIDTAFVFLPVVMQGLQTVTTEDLQLALTDGSENEEVVVPNLKLSEEDDENKEQEPAKVVAQPKRRRRKKPSVE